MGYPIVKADNTIEVKAIRKMIVEQLISSIPSLIGDTTTVKVDAFGYSISMDVTFFCDSKIHFNGYDFEQTEFMKVISIENRKEMFNGKPVRTFLFWGEDLSKEAYKILNAEFIPQINN